MTIDLSNDSAFVAATQVRENAYAPYSSYQVGACMESAGESWVGCNVENVSFGATLCAERVALFTMVSAGCRRWDRLVVVTQDGGAPCGLCLQALLEFAHEDSVVDVVSVEGIGQRFRFSQLLPQGFGSALVKRTDSAV